VSPRFQGHGLTFFAADERLTFARYHARSPENRAIEQTMHVILSKEGNRHKTSRTGDQLSSAGNKARVARRGPVVKREVVHELLQCRNSFRKLIVLDQR
jgi:hypothetical protein